MARSRRRYVRLVVEPYRGDRLRPDALVATVSGLHALVTARGPRRLVCGQPSVAVEVHVHVRGGGAPLAWLAVCVPRGLERQAQAALRATYPNCAVRPLERPIAWGRVIIRLHKRWVFTEAIRRLADVDPDRPPVERLLRTMAAAGGPSAVQIALTPAPAIVGWRQAAAGAGSDSRADADFSEQPRVRGPFFYADVRVVGHQRRQVGAIAAELRAGGGANRLVGHRVAPGRRWVFDRRVARGEGNPVPAPVRGTYAAEEIAGLWQLPSVEFAAVAFRRRPTPLAPAPAGILRVGGSGGLVADQHGRVTIHADLRRQNTAVVGTVEQGKTSYLVASVREDLRRDDCAVVVLDPKGDAADAALSCVPDGRVCTVLDLARPTCGFNPLDVRAPIDAIADYVVAALRQLFADGEVRGSSDRYLRNALIAVLAYDRRASLWDVARLLEVGPAGVALRAEVAHRLATQPEFAEVACFLADELPGQLADARASTTAKLDAPANKLARVLNSASVKRVLLNRSVCVDFDRLIEQREVLIVRGALGELGAGNVSVLMQLLVGMLDAALARAQDRRDGGRATAVALKVDEAPLVINAAFAQTMALKRSAGLETVACWQTDAQWPAELREQLDALFAHRVSFATASAIDARAAAGLLMAEFSDQLRSGDQAIASLASPDVRLHLPRHTAICSWSTPTGRERPFIGRTLPLTVDPERIAGHAERQRARGGREVESLAPPPRLDQLPPAAADAEVERARPRREVESVAQRWPPGGLDKGGGGRLGELDAAVVVRAPRRVERRVDARTRAIESVPPGVGGTSATSVSPAEAEAEAESTATDAGAGRVATWASRNRERGGLVRDAASDVPDPAGCDAVQTAVERDVEPELRRPSASVRPGSTAPGHTGRARPSTSVLRADAAVSPAWVELCAVDAAERVRWLPVPPARRRPALDAAELELLAWLAAARCGLSSQAHRRMSPGKALTTTQRRLKRLADAGLVARFQLHGGDGGGVPFCCAVTEPGLELLEITSRRAPVLCDDRLGELRTDIHTVGWLLALESRAGASLVGLLGPGRARLAPSGGPDGLRLDPGLHARDFVTGPDRRPVERFRPVIPVAAAELAPEPARPERTTDLLVFAEPAARADALDLLERLDHLLAGWWRLVPRYARLGSPPAAVVLCADARRARALAATADGVLAACLARIGQPPDAWEYPGRRGVAFAAEQDLHDGRLEGWRVHPLVPELRRDTAGAAPRREAILALPAPTPGWPRLIWR